ncbi:hypothetical protein WI92_22540 [Burkholderia vietnamiensis]|nr:hypothetical protein WI92_22540 [Burkholderia vietnamiensis]
MTKQPSIEALAEQEIRRHFARDTILTIGTSRRSSKARRRPCSTDGARSPRRRPRHPPQPCVSAIRPTTIGWPTSCMRFEAVVYPLFPLESPRWTR